MNPRDGIVLKREVDDQDRRNKLAVDRRKYCQLGWPTTGSVYRAKRRPLSSQVDNIVATIDVPWRNFLSLEFWTKYPHFCRYRNFLSTRRKPACQKTSSIRTKGSTERRLVTNTRQTHTHFQIHRIGPQLRTPDGRKCWAGNVVDGWRNADAAACQHWRPGCSAPTDTMVRGRSDTGKLSLPAWREPQSVTSSQRAVGRAVSDQSRDQTSECRW